MVDGGQSVELVKVKSMLCKFVAVSLLVELRKQTTRDTACRLNSMILMGCYQSRVLVQAINVNSA